MANVKAVWGIDIGQCALKALRLELAADGSVDLTHFDLIEHPKILSQPDAEADQLIRNALDKFLSRNEIGGARVVLAVPGQSSFARFIKLPPVEPKRIPEIVRFEAVQQIPFDIEEVEWDYQTFISPRSPDVEVGIFAMRKELVLKHLAHLRQARVEADVVQLAPLALYNMMAFDGLAAKQGATLLIDVGAQNTDLVISDGERIWLRSIPLGGNNFTDSLVKAFKLPFSKAENLKRTAATSKYARQIFVAMRPVFGDLVSEIQRSIGFYTTLHRDAQINRAVCMGNAFRLPGLQKYLEQNLQVEAVRPGAFHRLKPGPTVNAPAFAENLWSFAVAYGLAVQGLGQAPINSNLLPFSIARQRTWRAQRPWFAAAAAAMLLGVGWAGWSAVKGAGGVNEQLRQAEAQARPVLAKHMEIQREKATLSDKGVKEQEEIRDITQIVDYRDTVLQVMYLVHAALPNEWRGEAIQKVALAEGLAPEKVDWRQHVWPVVAGSDFQRTMANKIYLLEQVRVEFYPQKPPPYSAEPAPGAPPASVVAATPSVPGEKYFRVTIIGLTNATEVARSVHTAFLERMVRLKEEDAKADNHLLNVELSQENIGRALRGYDPMDVPPASWPPVPGSAATGPAPAGPTPAMPAAGPPLAPGAVAEVKALEYKIHKFTVSFDVKIVPRKPSAAGPGRVEPRG